MSTDWALDVGTPSVVASEASAGTPARDEVADRTAMITARLKTIYRKVVLPVEKRYQYDYFYESPFLSDSEFDGKGKKTNRYRRPKRTRAKR